MSQFKNAMEVFKLLNKSNCRDCNSPTCLAFAAAVFQGRKQLDECPHLTPEDLRMHEGKNGAPTPMEKDLMAAMEHLKNQITEVDLSSVANKLGASFDSGRLTLKILGKDFSVDGNGKCYSDIHVHPWIISPVLSYILESSGAPLSGKWVPLRELRKGMSWRGLFEQRCEKPLKKIADTYTDLFKDMIDIFNGRPVERFEGADISLVLHPLPKVPVLICYWQPEDGMESSLHLFFDEKAEDHLSIEAIYGLGTGLVQMFEKISLRHGLS